jgi:hypothetical protein
VEFRHTSALQQQTLLNISFVEPGRQDFRSGRIRQRLRLTLQFHRRGQAGIHMNLICIARTTTTTTTPASW